jgi:hypothetical protein
MLLVDKRSLIVALLLVLVGDAVADRYSGLRVAFDLDLPEDDSFFAWGRRLRNSMSMSFPDAPTVGPTPKLRPPTPMALPTTRLMDPYISPLRNPSDFVNDAPGHKYE